MVTLKLTSFNGTTKAISLSTPSDVRTYMRTLSQALPKSVVLHVSCDALGISGHVKGEK